MMQLLGLVFGMELVKISKLYSCKIQPQKEIRKYRKQRLRVQKIAELASVPGKSEFDFR
jgi:hypothetical protein